MPQHRSSSQHQSKCPRETFRPDLDSNFFITSVEGTAKQELSKAEVEDGEIEDAKMTDLPSAQETQETKTTAVSQTETATSIESAHTAMDTRADAMSNRPPADQRGLAEPPPRPRPVSRASDSGRQTDLPKRPEPERTNSQRQQGRLPRHGDNRLPPRPDLLDDRRDRGVDFNPRTRHGGPDHHRSFEGPGPGRVNDREREFGIRPPPDEPMRGPPYREGRLPREPEWPGGRHGRPRPSEQFHGRDGPPRGELMPDFPDGPRRGEPMRSDRPPRPLSPPRSDLPNRPERFPDERRSASFNQPPSRLDDFPRGPRNDRGFDMRDNAMPPELSHGRLRQPEPPTEIPSGPRGGRNRGNRNVSGPAANGRLASPERQLPTGPSRQNARGGPEQPSAPPAHSPAAEALDTSGIHPDRLGLFEPPQQTSPAALTPPSGPRGGAGPHPGPRGPGGDRGRGDKRFAGINNMLQQTGGPAERGGATPPGRGRGANRQPNTANTSSPQTSNRPPTGPAAEEDTQPRNRPEQRGDLIDDVAPDTRRSGRDRGRDKERERRGDEAVTGSGGNRREERRDRARDSDRERNRRSDVGGGAGREDKERDRERHAETRETLRRAPSSREELRRRERRDRDDGPPDSSAPVPNANENEGRLRPPSSMGAPPPPPPPPPPPLPSDESNARRWGSGGDRPSRSDNRDRERERRGDRGREREHRESGGGSTHRKRGRPNPEDGSSGDGGARGPRMGNENKRPRRGA